MQQTEILSLVEKLIGVYNADDFDFVLAQLTEGSHPSVKLLVKMELKKVMAPCSKSIDLRGRVQGECREYRLDGKKHWLDDVALNSYHKNTKKFGGYTEGVWDAVTNTSNNFRVMHQSGPNKTQELTHADSPFEAEPIKLGFHLRRNENRLKVASQVEITLDDNTELHGLSVDLSNSGARFKLPSAFKYNLGDILSVRFTELQKSSQLDELKKPIEFRVLGIEEFSESVRLIRALRLTDTGILEKVINSALKSEAKRAQHDNQDKIVSTRTKGFEHAYLKHTCNLPLFFSGKELKLAMLTDNNHPIWQYWHDERNQQTLGTLFNSERMESLTKQGIRNSSNMLYSFTHEHKERTLFYSMMLPEASREQRQLFWHIGARRPSWKAFRLQIFELSVEESAALAENTKEMSNITAPLTHCGILQEISNSDSSIDYLLTEKPNLAPSALNPFRHPRQIIGRPIGMYFDDQSRRKEPRYHLKSPLTITTNEGQSFDGFTLDLSKHGLSIKLNEPGIFKAGETIKINFKELQLYDKSTPLSAVPYEVIRTNNHTLQLAIVSTGDTLKSVLFFQKLIKSNKEKLHSKKELLPSPHLLECLHGNLLEKMVSTPFFVDKEKNSMRTKIIGVNYPLPNYVKILTQLGHNQHISLEPIFKGHTNTLLAQPMKRIDGAEPTFNEVYLSVAKFGERVQSIETKLRQEFESTKDRIRFIKKAKTYGEFYALRLSGAPVFNSLSHILQKDLLDLTLVNVHTAKVVEKEITDIIGYGEIVDITDEVLIRLELT